MRLNFKQLPGTCATWVSKKLNNGDFDYYLVKELVDMDSACGDVSQGNYRISLAIVSPEQITDDRIQESILDFYGIEEPWSNVAELAKVEAIYSYMGGVVPYISYGNNYRQLSKQARLEAIKINSLFGFYMDAPRNALGATGWEIIQGNNMGCLAA